MVKMEGGAARLVPKNVCFSSAYSKSAVVAAMTVLSVSVCMYLCTCMCIVYSVPCVESSLVGTTEWELNFLPTVEGVDGQRGRRFVWF